MNIFREAGDLLHVIAIIILFQKIWSTRSCAGISAKSQILLLLVYVTRYLDLFTYFLSWYNSIMKLMFLTTSGLVLGLIFIMFKETYDRKQDSFRVPALILSCFTLACCINHDTTMIEVMWTFSIYLEAVAMLPQFFMIGTGNMDPTIKQYLLLLGCYRAFYLINWVYRYYDERHYDNIAVAGGIVQTIVFCEFFLLQVTQKKKNEMNRYLNCRVRVALQDSRIFVGIYKGCDKFRNLILESCDEYLSKQFDETRFLGRVLLRTDDVMSMAVEQPMQAEKNGVLMPFIGAVDEVKVKPPPSDFQISIKTLDGENRQSE